MTARSISKFAATLFAAILAVFPITTPTGAQIGLPAGAPYARVTVPFAFEFGPRHLDAGTYEIAQVTGHIIRLRKAHSVDAGTMLMVMQEDGSSISNKGKVVFHKYGDSYFLSEVWRPGYSEHVSVPLTRTEKQLRAAATANNVAANSPTGFGATVIALLAQ